MHENITKRVQRYVRLSGPMLHFGKKEKRAQEEYMHSKLPTNIDKP